MIGVHRAFAKILTQFKKNLFVESAKIGFDEAFLGRAGKLNPEIEGTAVCQMP